MLTPILSRETCSRCKICCNYTSESLWDIPGFTLEEYHNAIKKYPDMKSKSYFRNGLYYFSPIPYDNGIYLCPFLSQQGCKLEKNKPIKCAIWPLYVINYKNNKWLVMSNVCPNIPKISPYMLENELCTTFRTIKNIMQKHPELIEDWREHFEFITRL